jgi:DNA-binding NarL/FixJ family response regulator
MTETTPAFCTTGAAQLSPSEVQGYFMKHILFVDDHPIYRDGVRRVLESSDPDIKVHTADGITSASSYLAETNDIDLCLTDYRLLDGDGVTLVRRVRSLYPSIAVGMLCAEPTLSLADEIRSLGAVACLSKDRDPVGLCEAIQTLYNGGTIFDNVARNASENRTLSLRRREILVFAGQGLLDKQIGEKMGISESTVRNHWQLSSYNWTSATAPKRLPRRCGSA